jgi:hypothetical protein
VRKKRVLGLHEQLAFLRLHWPGFCSRIHGKALVSTGVLCPSKLSVSYKVRIDHCGGVGPEVRVLDPELKRRTIDEPIPHMYGQERLCLFLPGSREWEPKDPIALTVIPWASLWLYFYEHWRATGEWLGGGIHPDETMTVRGDVSGRSE